VPGRYGGVIGGEGNCCASAVKTVELDGPLRRRILCMELDGVIKHACVKKTAGISWGFHISHRDLTAASKGKERASKKIEVSRIGANAGERGNGAVHSPTRPVTYLCLCTSRISFEGCEGM